MISFTKLIAKSCELSISLPLPHFKLRVPIHAAPINWREMKVRFFVHESPRIGPKETKIEADLRFSVRWLVHPISKDLLVTVNPSKERLALDHH